MIRVTTASLTWRRVGDIRWKFLLISGYESIAKLFFILGELVAYPASQERALYLHQRVHILGDSFELIHVVRHSFRGFQRTK